MLTGRIAVVLGVALLAGVANPSAAQKYPGPAKVTAQGNGTSVTVSWAPVPFKGATYRVLRALDVKQTGKDLTPPLVATSFDDNNIVAGATYFYQVIAVFPDGTTGAADPVMVTVPNPAPPVTAVIPSGARSAITGPPMTLAPGSTRRNVLAKPTAVTGITVNGTLASAVVSWAPVTGAVSYSVARTMPNYYASGAPVAGITATTWTDLGPMAIGFTQPGVYRYDVAALLNDGTTVSGQASWTRPDPTCAALPPNQPLQPILDPLAPALQFTSSGLYPNGALFGWIRTKSSPVVAYRMERSVQGTNSWVLAGTSCGTAAPISNFGLTPTLNMAFADPLGGVVPGTTYLYKLTAIAANGEAGWNSVAWTAPNPSLVRWLAPTITAYNIYLRWRYEPPASGAPTLPDAFQLTSGYGLVKTLQGVPCNALAGCAVKDTILPGRHGAQQFRVTAGWAYRRGMNSAAMVTPMGSLTADTVITIP